MFKTKAVQVKFKNTKFNKCWSQMFTTQVVRVELKKKKKKSNNRKFDGCLETGVRCFQHKMYKCNSKTQSSTAESYSKL